jgi:hemerythrin
MIVSTPAFQWTERYSVNIAALDHQHRGLFATINELNEALATGEAASVTDPILQKLVDYALTHFASEESLMTRHKFPGFATHRFEHDKFTQAVTKFLEDYHAGKPGVPVSLMLFLQTWLKEHILVTDKGYSKFLNAQGVR